MAEPTPRNPSPAPTGSTPPPATGATAAAQPGQGEAIPPEGPGGAARPPGAPPLHVARGFLMGLADVVPGVSGGTIALILGIYTRFITALAAFDRAFLAHLARAFRGRPGLAAFGRHLVRMDILFLVWIGTGILVAIFTAAHGVGYLLAEHPVPLMALFLGLILTSARIPWKHIEQHDTNTWSVLVAGVAVAAVVSLIPPAQGTPSAAFIVLGGFIAISFMLLPGVSGASVLVLLGIYEGLLAAVRGFDLPVIALFGAGAVAGFLVASKALRALLARYSDATHAALTGLMLGSLVRLWPWRDAPGFAAGNPVVPAAFDAQAAVVVAVALMGAFLSWGLEGLGAWRGRVPARKNG